MKYGGESGFGRVAQAVLRRQLKQGLEAWKFGKFVRRKSNLAVRFPFQISTNNWQQKKAL
ncbi:hypothetical protein BCV08_11780 [Vibrio breoganii]|nr:hypothetical protein BCV08_11780 [Vibrio breoganii]